MTLKYSNLSEEDIRKQLQSARNLGLDNPYIEIPHLKKLFKEDPRPAAVLIPLLRKNQDWHVLFTRRTETLPDHSGQVAFPGGQCDPEDLSPEATALREAHEEIGLIPGDVRILGSLNDFLTITNYCVTPIIGVIPWPYSLKISKIEVSRVFTIPLRWLTKPHNYNIRRRELPKPYRSVSVIYFQEYYGEILWGASARFMLTLLEVLFAN